jgi:hypothetical protein
VCFPEPASIIETHHLCRQRGGETNAELVEKRTVNSGLSPMASLQTLARDKPQRS